MEDKSVTSEESKSHAEKAKLTTSKSLLSKIFLSESFLEKLGLLILTAIISGLLIPYIGNNLQTRKAQNEVILQNQSKLLDDISNSLLTYETLILDVSWYKSSSSVEDPVAQEKSYNRYTDKVVDLFIQFRVEIVKSKNLISIEAAEKLDSFFTRIKKDQDIAITKLYVKKDASIKEWADMHEVSHKMLLEANELISSFAVDLGITKSNTK